MIAIITIITTSLKHYNSLTACDLLLVCKLLKLLRTSLFDVLYNQYNCSSKRLVTSSRENTSTVVVILVAAGTVVVIIVVVVDWRERCCLLLWWYT